MINVGYVTGILDIVYGIISTALDVFDFGDETRRYPPRCDRGSLVPALLRIPKMHLHDNDSASWNLT
jgi:hypothetical protein